MAKTSISKQLGTEIRNELKRLGLNHEKRVSKSAQSPNAAIANYDGSADHLENVESAMVANMGLLKLQNPGVWKVAYLLYNHGLRVSEVLSIRSIDITKAGQIVIKGKKRSNDRIIHPGELVGWFQECKKLHVDPFRDLDYFYVYRSFKKAGIMIGTKHSSKKSVTHAFRHMHIADLKNANIEVEKIAKHVGHKSKSNTERYGKY